MTVRFSGAKRLASLFVLVLALSALLVLPALAATSPSDDPITAQVDPYEPPEIVQVDLPSWAEPFEPFARLPLWAQAAIVSAGVAGVVFVVPIVTRWLWGLGEGAEQTSRDSEQ